ncbi:MAG: hypothetical protein IH620_01760 [Ignavibacterium sp.]|nr:hypothetical protein [Ignavibacterium sp.]
MKKRIFTLRVISILTIFLLFSLLIACSKTRDRNINIVGAWKGKVQFNNGEYAAIKDFEFMYVFNAGGTMTESSNYDGVPPTPPAYGIWKKNGDKQYEARYEFYWNKVPATFEDLVKTGGFTNAGYGVLLEKITLSEDGKSYSATINFNLFDQNGKQIVYNNQGTVEAKRMEFDSKEKD